MRGWILPGLLLALATPVHAGPEKTHTGVLKTGHFEVRYRPGSRAGAAAERDGARAEQDLARFCRQLDVANDGRYRLFLYDDATELCAINGLSGVGAFAAGRDVHAPFGDDQTRAHEIAHVVTARLARSGDERRTMFFPDGIANALLVHVHGVHVHAVAKFYRVRKQLPSLAAMTGAADYYAWLRERPGFNGYDVAASWLRHLLDTFPVGAVKAYYTGTPPKKAFGKPLAALEKGWHAALDAFVLRKEVELLLRRRAGEDVRFARYEPDPFLRLPPEVRGQAKDWQDVTAARLRKSVPSGWVREQGALRGHTPGLQWSWCDLVAKPLAHGALHVVFEPAPGCVGVAVRLGDGARALLTNAGTFLYAGEQQRAGSRAAILRGGRPVHVVLAQHGETVRVFVDGVQVLEHTLRATAGAPSVGVAGGSVGVTSIKVRRLPTR